MSLEVHVICWTDRTYVASAIGHLLVDVVVTDDFVD